MIYWSIADITIPTEGKENQLPNIPSRHAQTQCSGEGHQHLQLSLHISTLCDGTRLPDEKLVPTIGTSRYHYQPTMTVKVEPKSFGLCISEWWILFQPYPHGPYREKKPGTQEANQQRHMVHTWTRRLLRYTINDILTLSNILHPQDG